MLPLTARCRRLARAALLPLTLVPLLAAAAPASAGEMPIHYYKVEIEGEAQYAAHHEDPDGASGTSTADAAARFTWTTELSDLAFYDTTPTSAASTITVVHVEHASHRYHLANVEPEDGACTGQSADFEVQSAFLRGLPIPTADGGRHIAANVLDGVEIQLPNCTGKGHPTWFDLNEQPDGAEPFEATFEMPRAAVGNGKIIQLLERTVTGADCPNAGSYETSCELSWKAEVTFTKLRTEVVPTSDDDSDLVVPIAPEAPAAPAPPPAPAPSDDDALIVPLVPDHDAEHLVVPLAAQAKLTRTGATLPVSCPAGCSGEAVVTGVTGAARTAARARPLARAKFTVAPGARTTVRLRFGARARRAIARAKGVRIAVTATPRGGTKPVRRTLTLRRR